MKSLRSFFTFCFILFTLISSAQYDQSKIDKKAIEAYTKGLDKIDAQKWDDAVESFSEAIRRDPAYIDAYLSLAGVYGQLKNYEQSIKTYEKGLALDTNYTSHLRLPYAINLAGAGQFQKALNVIDALLRSPKLPASTQKAAEFRRKSFQFALDFAKTHPGNYVFAPQNLGGGINTSESEYFPSLTVAGSDMIFTRRLQGRNEDFFVAHKEDKNWGDAFRLNGSINTTQNEGAQNISQDGKWLVFTGCYRPDGAGSCDIYISYLNDDGWSEAINLGSRVNTDQWETQPCLSADKRDLYFVSRRPGGYGGSDIYVTHLGPTGRWSEPENLGPEINTSGDELTPFIHADNQTLYFASNGLQGYGAQDLFVTRKTANGKWSKPENLGYPINTVDEESALSIASDGVTAYYASDRPEGKGGLDIYSFEMRPGMRPLKTLWVKGKVFDQRTNAGLPSSVELVDIATNQTFSKVQTDETGNYLITLPLGKDYAFNVTRKGYLFYSDRFLLRNKTPDSTYQKNIPLQPIEVNAAVVLRNIFFDVKKYEIKPESGAELDRVAQFLKDNPTVRLQIEGHTDNVGSAVDNQKLSEQRARSVVNYLIYKGIKDTRLVPKGFGATQAIADNKTEEGRAQNRRTEAKVIAK
ncbi:MAG: flagellar motor protein MotB [Flaviaesturariibacter sp.]|nr:flagellar motor protein MotB [Flaviaesturariibacter sp.]